MERKTTSWLAALCTHFARACWSFTIKKKRPDLSTQFFNLSQFIQPNKYICVHTCFGTTCFYVRTHTHTKKALGLQAHTTVPEEKGYFGGPHHLLQVLRAGAAVPAVRVSAENGVPGANSFFFFRGIENDRNNARESGGGLGSAGMRRHQCPELQRKGPSCVRSLDGGTGEVTLRV